MPNCHNGQKKGISARVMPDVHDNLHELARLNGTDFAGLMVMLSKGFPLKYPDGKSVWANLKSDNDGE